ncbi:MAG: hypothetical protein JST00_36120 [Deltaproteobacteria bacterium]|nr:hypothetical protein [Deltaproteobacteria bacterium]
MRRRPWWSAGFSAIGTGALVLACWNPTEVRISLVTDLPCVTSLAGDGSVGAEAGATAPPTQGLRTGIYFGDDLRTADQQADTFRCVAGTPDSEIGELVVVPGDDPDRKVVVHVVMTVDGRPPDTCRGVGGPPTDPKSCIVARRTFRFIRHASRPITIRLDAVCRGVTCLDDETCINGRCQSGDIDQPDFDPECPSCGDAGPKEDATVTDAGQDATTPTCTGPFGTGSIASQSFASPALAVGDDAIFWISQDKKAVVRASKTAALPLDNSFFKPADGFVKSLAVDGKQLFVGTDIGLYRVDLTGAQGPKVVTTGDIRTVTAGGGLAFGYRGNLFSGELFRLAGGEDTPSATIGGVASAMTISGAHVYAVDGSTGLLERLFAANLSRAGSATVRPGARFVTAFGADRALLSVTASAQGEAGIFEVGPTDGPTPRFPAAAPGPLVARDGQLYVVDGTVGAVHVSRVALDAAGAALTPIEPVDYTNIASLAVDDCVYFFTDGPAVPTLRVRPKAGAK